MDPKRKRIYIIVIVICIVASGGILLMGRFGGGEGAPAPASPSNPSAQTSTAAPVTGDAKTGFSAPAVFPANSNFDFSVLDSGSFKLLQSYEAVGVQTEELGREDPFRKY